MTKMGKLFISLFVLAFQLPASTIYWISASPSSNQMNYAGPSTHPNWSTALTGTGGSALPTSTGNVVIDTSHNPLYNTGNPTTTGTFSFNSLTLMGTPTMVVNSSLTVTTGTTSAFNVGTGTLGTTPTAANTIQGTISVTTGGALTFNSANQGATISSTGRILIAGGSATLSGNLWSNAGTISQTSGTLSNLGTVTGGTLLGTVSNSGTLSGTTLSSATIIGGTIAGNTVVAGTSSLQGTNAGNYPITITGHASSNNGWVILSGNSTVINAGGSLSISGSR